MNETICAIATTMGVSSINIIRLSGDKCIEIVSKIFKGKDLTKVEANTINYGHIIYEDKIIDEVLVSIFKSPKSFTCEDVVEINCHGGIAITNKILEILLISGCRLALPGEFTKRAYLNGRIDLLEVEGIMQLISAQTEASRQLAISQVTHQTTTKINNIRGKIMDIIANIEVNFDYPEYEDILELTPDLIIPRLEELNEECHDILENSMISKIITEGLTLGIVGRPNVGKSSILNMLISEEKAIVSNEAGTTRDTVEGTIMLDGMVIKLLDTAGIHEANNHIEEIGINKSYSIIENSDFVMLVLNNNESLSKYDIELLEMTKNKSRLILVNKSDLESKLDLTKLDEYVLINTINEENRQTILDMLSLKLKIGKIKQTDYTYLTSARSIALFKQVTKNLEETLREAKNNNLMEIIEISLKEAWEYLGAIIGNNESDELLDTLFSNYCLGK